MGLPAERARENPSERPARLNGRGDGGLPPPRDSDMRGQRGRLKASRARTTRTARTASCSPPSARTATGCRSGCTSRARASTPARSGTDVLMSEKAWWARPASRSNQRAQRERVPDHASMFDAENEALIREVRQGLRALQLQHRAGNAVAAASSQGRVSRWRSAEAADPAAPAAPAPCRATCRPVPTAARGRCGQQCAAGAA